MNTPAPSMARFTIVLLALGACAPTAENTSTPPRQASGSGTPSSNPAPPRSLPTRTQTSVPVALSATGGPTLTVVPSPTSACPTGQEASTVVDRGVTFELGGLMEEPIATFLNSGGTVARLLRALQTLCGSLIPGTRPLPLRANAVATDVTGDDISDVVVTLSIPYGNSAGEAHVFVFVRSAGMYQPHTLFLRAGAGSAGEFLYEGGGPELLPIVDMNADGLKEVAFAVHWPGYTEFYIGEWRSERFDSLITIFNPLEMANVSYISALAATGQVADLDGDGTLELVIDEGVPGDLPIFPARLRHQQVWAWDGQMFSLRSTSIRTTPTYRIEAIIFGDLAWRTFHETQLAIDLYQQAVFDQILKPGSPGRPEEFSTEAENAAETERLAAFGRFRIIMGLAYLGDHDSAQVALDNLLAKVPQDSAGYPYLLMSYSFWSAYEAKGSFSQACQAAEAYATAHSAEIIEPLGPEYYGAEYVLDPGDPSVRYCGGWLYGPG